MPNLDETALRVRMKKAQVPGVSIAYLDSDKGTISSKVFGTTDLNASAPLTTVKPDTVFGAASLSKPVFSYLVLKLMNDNKIPTSDASFLDLDTPLSDILPIEKFYKQFLNTNVSSEYAEKSRGLTARMILSHTTGIPIDGSPKFLFDPGTEYEYTGMGLLYLQKVIEKQTNKSLEVLAQEEVFKPLHMSHSSFLPPAKPDYMSPTQSSAAKAHPRPNVPLTPPIAANSLHTTASDYALFVHAIMQDAHVVEMFTPAISLTRDGWAKAVGVSSSDRQHLAWGLGFGLQMDDDGVVTTAFHSGDMNQWRGWVAIDLKAKSAVVYFANGVHHKAANGHVLADVIVTPNVSLEHGSKWFFQKFGFARDVKPGWQDKEKAAMAKIGTCLAERSAKSQPDHSSGPVSSVDSDASRHYKDKIKDIRPQPGYMKPTESSLVREKERYSPLSTTPKPPWKQS